MLSLASPATPPASALQAIPPAPRACILLCTEAEQFPEQSKVLSLSRVVKTAERLHSEVVSRYGERLWRATEASCAMCSGYCICEGALQSATGGAPKPQLHYAGIQPGRRSTSAAAALRSHPGRRTSECSSCTPQPGRRSTSECSCGQRKGN